MDGPEAPAFRSAWTVERDNISARQDAELARLDRRLASDRANAQATYEDNLKLLDGLLPRQYGEILLCFRDNLQLRQEKAEVQHANLQAAKQEEHKKELQAHFEKFHFAMKRNPSPASTTAGIPSPVSMVPASRANSILHTVEIKSPAPETGCITDSVVSSIKAAQEETQTASNTPPAQSPVPGILNRDSPTAITQKPAEEEEPLPSSSTVSEQPQPSSKRPLEHSDANRVISPENLSQEPPKKKKKSMPNIQDHKPLTDRVKTWEAVSTDAIHFDAIVEYPTDSGLFYVLFCEEHGLHFKNKLPMGAAAKHLHSDLHGNMKRQWDIAVKHLGYLVTGCDRKKQALHNQKVDDKFVAGYIPQTNTRFFNSPAKLAKAAAAAGGTSAHPANGTAKPQSTTPIPRHLTPALKPSQPSEPGSQPEKTSPGRIGKGIVNPKKFHIYLGKWPGAKGPSFHPVMILGWDSQKGSGLPGTLNDTQLLDQGSDPPGCYNYDVAFEKITGWAEDYEDGGLKVGSRKFPVLFFDGKRSVSWIPAGYLQKYALYETMTDRKDIKTQREVRDFIASREGFTSWAAFQKARNPDTRGISTQAALAAQSKDVEMADHDIEDMELDDYDSSLECETSSDTEELKRLFETAGEIPGDDDYSGSQDTTQGKDDVDMVEAASPKAVYRKSFITTRSSDLEKAARKPVGARKKLMARRSVCSEKTKIKPAIKPQTETRPEPNGETKSHPELPRESSPKLVDVSQKQDQSQQQPGTNNRQGINGKDTVSQHAEAQKEISTPGSTNPAVGSAQSKEKTTTQYSAPSLTQKDFARISVEASPAPIDPAEAQITKPPTVVIESLAVSEPAPTSHTDATSSDSHGSKETIPNSKGKPQNPVQPTGPAHSVGSVVNVSQAQLGAERILAWKPASELQHSPAPSTGLNTKPVASTPMPFEMNEGTKPAGQPAGAARLPALAVPVTHEATEVDGGCAVANKDLQDAQVTKTNAAPVAHMGSTPVSATPISTGTSAAFSRDSSVATSIQSPIMSSSSIPRVEFSIMSYAQGATSWKKIVPQDKCIKVSSEGPVLKSQAGSPVAIMIEPCAIQTFRRRPYGLDNYTMTLVPIKNDEPAMHVVFGGGTETGGVSGKVQTRRFVRWMQAINPQLVVSE